MTPTTSPTGSIDAAVPPARRRRGTQLIVLTVGVLVGAVAGVLALREPVALPPRSAAADAADLGDQLAALQARVDRSPDDIAGWQALASVAVRRAAQVGDPAYYDVAQHALDRADAVVADDPLTLVARGELALALHRFDDALRYGSMARPDLADSPAVLGVIVDAQVELGRYDDAAATLQRMLDLRPGVAALSRASYLRELNGDLDGAEAAMRRAADTASGATPAYATVTALRGDLAFQRGDLAAAGDRYAQALDAAPELVQAAIGAARVQAANGDVAGAAEQLATVVERLPTPEAVVLLADLHRLQGRTDHAERDDELARALVRLQSRQGQATDLELALFEADRGDRPAHAVALARRAHAARPDNVYAEDALAWALARDGDVDAARPLIRAALRLGSVDPQLRFHAAWILARSGEADAARRHLTFVAERNPWFSFALLDEAAQLARELGVTPPAAWRPR